MHTPVLSLHLSARRGAVSLRNPKRVWPSVGPAVPSLGSARPFVGKPRPDALRALDADKAGADLPALSFAEFSERLLGCMTERERLRFHDICSRFVCSTSLQDWSAVVSEKGEESFS
ncbi:hypothetical protein [uncultured Cohaesibacter sp.]|uniref:hypothetical protein n=1 Tax=uncultured Cohaesibacter sp. TaxID=1002546 RepID=UPI002AAABB3A|nr:hypothetical protein [uncultured Cohaesibacter sp.]